MSPTINLFSITRPFARSTLRWSLLVGAAVLLITLGARLGSASVEGAPTPLPAISVAAWRTGPSGCWVSGDLVGEANPVAVAAVLCGVPQR